MTRSSTLRWAVTARWRRIRRATGAFRTAEVSPRASSLTRAWESTWPGGEPISYELRSGYPDRWVRLHSLPQSKQYADVPEEYAEIIRRHRAVLAVLLAGQSVGSLVAIAQDYGWRDVAAGWTRERFQGAWPWRRYDDPEVDAPSYFWVRDRLSSKELDTLLLDVADERADVILADPGLSWLYCPYDGGADIIARDVVERQALADRFADWLPAETRDY